LVSRRSRANQVRFCAQVGHLRSRLSAELRPSPPRAPGGREAALAARDAAAAA